MVQYRYFILVMYSSLVITRYQEYTATETSDSTDKDNPCIPIELLSVFTNEVGMQPLKKYSKVKIYGCDMQHMVNCVMYVRNDS